MIAIEKRQRIIESNRRKKTRYSDSEVRQAIKKTAGALSALKSENIEELKTEGMLCN